MKKLIYSIFAVIATVFFAQCSDWTEIEANYTDPVNIHGDEYYEALRAYKKSKHPIVFGWYSDWIGKGTDMYNQLRGIPDSMDIVSIWGNSYNLTPEQWSDLQEVREKKGTKVLVCLQIMNLGQAYTPAEVEQDYIVNGVQYETYNEAMAAYWGWYKSSYDGSEEAQNAIRKYAQVIADSINKYGYDGFDIDFEPNYGYRGNLSGSNDAMHVWLSELSKYFGPKSNTGKLLVVDGEPQTLNTESGPLLNYYIIQAYYCTGDTNLDGRFNNLLNKFGSVEDESTILSKTVWCEDFEKHKADGGPQFTTRDGVTTYSLMGMAMYYRPEVDARIGGVGAYRFNLCRPLNDYVFMREVIQYLNPAQN